jgi:hypothetical protein
MRLSDKWRPLENESRSLNDRTMELEGFTISFHSGYSRFDRLIKTPLCRQFVQITPIWSYTPPKRPQHAFHEIVVKLAILFLFLIKNMWVKIHQFANIQCKAS